MPAAAPRPDRDARPAHDVEDMRSAQREHCERTMGPPARVGSDDDLWQRGYRYGHKLGFAAGAEWAAARGDVQSGYERALADVEAEARAYLTEGLYRNVVLAAVRRVRAALRSGEEDAG